MKPLYMCAMEAFIRAQAQRFASRPALRWCGRSWSYRELDQISDLMAAGLLRFGVGRDSHVGIWAESVPEKVFFFYALQKLGAVAVMVNSRMDQREMLAMLAQTDTHFLAIGRGQPCLEGSSGARQALLESPQLQRVFYLGDRSYLPSGTVGTGILMEVGRAAFKDLAALPPARPEDPALILFTSGTTGSRPKAVVSNGFNLVNGGIQKADSLRAGPEDVFCSALPLCHVFGIDVNLLAALACGGCLALPRDHHTQSILRCVHEDQCTLLSAVPSIFHSIITREDLPSFDLSSLRAGVIGGAYCSPEMFCRIERTLGFTLLAGLGQTEATAGITISGMDDPLPLRSTSVGRFVPHMEGKIAAPATGEPLPAGEIGEVCVRGKLLMRGYYGGGTQSPIDAGGWLHTGDLGRLDADGNVFLCGRIKEIINRGGEKILPGEVEQWLEKLPQVERCKVIGVPDPYYGEEVCACVQASGLSAEEVRAYLRGKLSYFKVPRYILFFPSLPVTETGKVRLQEVRQMAARRLAIPEPVKP